MHHANLLQQLQQGCYQDVQDVNLARLMRIAIEGPEKFLMFSKNHAI